MKTSSCKAKGRKLQQLIALDLSAFHPDLTVDDVVSRPMGSPGPDIMMSSRAKKMLGIWDIECKNQESFSNIYKAFKQIQERNEDESEVKPLLVVKKNNEKPLAIVEWKHFYRLLTENVYLRERN